MANNVLLPPNEGPDFGSGRSSQPPAPTLRPLDDVTLSGEIKATEQGVFSSLAESIRDVFFPKKLPPLVLTSQPVPVVDRMAVKRDPTSVAISTVINVGVIALLLWIAARQTGIIAKPKAVPVISIDVPATPTEAPTESRSDGRRRWSEGSHPGNPRQSSQVRPAAT